MPAQHDLQAPDSEDRDVIFLASLLCSIGDLCCRSAGQRGMHSKPGNLPFASWAFSTPSESKVTTIVSFYVTTVVS
jgi:hypothetical protein